MTFIGVTGLLMDLHRSQKQAYLQLAILQLQPEVTSGQSYKASTIVIYDSRVVPDLKIPHIMTLDS